jgi:hypothetical protein
MVLNSVGPTPTRTSKNGATSVRVNRTDKESVGRVFPIPNITQQRSRENRETDGGIIQPLSREELNRRDNDHANLSAIAHRRLAFALRGED